MNLELYQHRTTGSLAVKTGMPTPVGGIFNTFSGTAFVTYTVLGDSREYLCESTEFHRAFHRVEAFTDVKNCRREVWECQNEEESQP